MRPDQALTLRVQATRELTTDLRELTMTSADGRPLPAFSPGSHVTVFAGDDGEHPNAYSLACDPARDDEYRIIVRRLADGRGGSRWLHGSVDEGQTLRARGPYNLFHPPATARRHVLVAAGVGITPFISYIRRFVTTGVPFELHYAARDSQTADAAIALGEVSATSTVSTYVGPEARLMLPALADRVLPRQPLGTHLSVCGPGSLMEAVIELGRRSGWAPHRMHLERFSVDPGERSPFVTIPQPGGEQIVVSAEETLLEALERRGISIPYLCRQGVCGECRTRVVTGQPDHRDVYLSEREREQNTIVMPCVSRCAVGPLVLDVTQAVA